MIHRILRRLPVLAVLALLVLGLTGAGVRAEDTVRSFPETGMTVGGTFLQYWQSRGGLAQFGYPISDTFAETSPLNEETYTVQYFERAVFEAHPENQPPYDVLLSQLGTFRYREKYPDGAPDQHPAAGGRLFPETGHVVGGAFLTYWQTHGGLAAQGYPISDEFAEVSPLDGKVYRVQYFERAVFEAHPENQPPYDVLLSQLGRFRYEQQYQVPPPIAGTEPGGSPTPATAPPTATPTSAPGSADWPMYGHDTARTNYNPGETVLNEENVGQLAPRWQADLGSSGTPPAGGPIVAGGRVYAGSSAPSGPNYFAFDARTGTRIWGANLNYTHSDCDDVGIGATAAISGSILVAGGGDAAYYGLNADTGAILWRHALDLGPSTFAWESPLIANGRAYLGTSSRCDNPSVRGEIRAVDLQTGALLAAQAFVPQDRAGAGIWNSPALSPDGRTLVAATGEDFAGYNGAYNRALVTLDPLTLAIRQANRQGATDVDEDWGTTPIIFPDSRGRTLVGANHKNGTFYAYDLNNLDAGPIWQVPTGVSVGMMPAYNPAGGGTLYVAGNNGRIYTLDPTTGVLRRPPMSVSRLFGNMAVANDLIFANTGATGVQIFNARTGARLATLQPANAGRTYSGVVVAGGVVYWLSGSYLNAWGLPAAP
jgi:outer membrane protein assembly factor BamB